MLFKRRHKPSLFKRVRSYVWPHAGWGRATRYVFHRTARLPGSPYSLAAGFACGAAISFTPLVGLHLVLGALLAWLMRASIVASAIGTLIGNPWTFPFIWIWIYRLGDWMGAGVAGNGPDAHRLDFTAFFGEMVEAVLSLDMGYLLETAAPVWWPMFVGGLPTAVAIWVAFYFPLRYLIAGHQARRLAKRLKRQVELGLVPEDRRQGAGDRRTGDWNRRRQAADQAPEGDDRRHGAWDRRHGPENRRRPDESDGHEGNSR